MKNLTGSVEEAPKENLCELRYNKEKPLFVDFDLLAGVKKDYRFPSFDGILNDLQENEADNIIYQQLEKYSKVLNREKLNP